MQPPASSMFPPPMAAQPPYQQPSMTQQPQYQVPPPHSGYYYQQPPQQQSQYTEVSSLPTRADEIRTFWVGDLQFWMDEQYLYNCFAQTGEVVSAKVIRNKQTQQSEGYGFIEFNSHAAAERNLQAYNGTLMPNIEKNFRLNWASLGSGEKRSENTPEYTIFVGDLAADVTDYMLQETFRANYLSIKGAKVVTDRATGHTKGYGFVRFGDESEQLRAMTEMNGKFCSTRPMRIGPAANKKNAGGQMQGQFFGNYGQLLHVKIPAGKHCGFVQYADRSCAEEALRALSGTQLGGQTIRLSWGRCPSNKQQSQGDPNQWSGGYYEYTPGYDAYGYAQPTQDPNMYYSGYAGYGNYAQPLHQQLQMSQQPQ